MRSLQTLHFARAADGGVVGSIQVCELQNQHSSFSVRVQNEDSACAKSQVKLTGLPPR